MNDEKLKQSEAHEIAKYILNEEPFVKRLMRLGYDTLIVKGQTYDDALEIKLSDHANLDSFFLP
jgi:hypothetical protein